MASKRTFFLLLSIHLRSLLSAILIAQLSIPMAMAEDEDEEADSDETPTSVDNTFNSGDVNTTTDDEGQTTSMEFNMTDATGLDVTASVLDYLAVIAGSVVGAYMTVKCQAIFPNNPSLYVYGIGAWLHIVAEIVNMIIFSSTAKNIADTYKGKITISGATENYAAQADALVAARDVNQKAYDYLKIKRWLMLTVSLAYAAAFAVAIIEVVAKKTEAAVPATAPAAAAKQAASLALIELCQKGSEAEDATMNTIITAGGMGGAAAIGGAAKYHDEVDFYQKPMTFLKSKFPVVPGKKINGDSSLEELSDYYTRWKIQYSQLVGGEKISYASEYQKNLNTFEQFAHKHGVFKKMKEGILAIQQLSLISSAYALTSEEDTLMSDSSSSSSGSSTSTSSDPAYSITQDGGGWDSNKGIVGGIVTVVGAGAFLILKPLKLMVFTWLKDDMMRAVYLGVLTALAGVSAGFIFGEAEAVKKRIDEYNAIINELSKLQGSEGGEGSTTTTVDREVNPALLGSTTTQGAICVDENMQTDSTCSCAVNNSCYSVTIPESSFSGFQMPDFGMSALSSGAGMVSNLSSGNLSGADATGASLEDSAIRAQAKVKDELNKLLAQSGNKANAQAARDGFRNMAKASIKKALGADSSKVAGLDFGDLGWGKNLPTDPKKAVEEMTKVVDQAKSDAGTAPIDPLAGFNFDLGGKPMAGVHSGAVTKVDEAKSLGNLDVNYSDIHSDDRNLFDVLSNRYLMSYPRLLDEKK